MCVRACCAGNAADPAMRRCKKQTARGGKKGTKWWDWSGRMCGSLSKSQTGQHLVLRDKIVSVWGGVEVLSGSGWGGVEVVRERLSRPYGLSWA